MAHITRLPPDILEFIIARSDCFTWSLVSKQFAALAASPSVRADWLADRARSCQIPPRLVASFKCTCGKLIKDADLSPFSPSSTASDWDNSFLESCDKQFSIRVYNPEIGAYRPHIPAACKLIRMPSDRQFIDYAVVHTLHQRHPAAFRRIREFLLCWSAFWRDEEATCFCLDQGARVNYARGWVLARFACDRQVNRVAIVRRLVFEYDARLNYHYHNNGATNVLGAVLMYQNDEGLALEILEKALGPDDLVENHGEPIIFQAADENNLSAVRFLLEYRRRQNPDGLQSLVQELVNHIKYWGVTGELMQMLLHDYGAYPDVSPEAFWYVIRAHEEASEDFSLIQLYLDHGAVLNKYQLAYAIRHKPLFYFLCEATCEYSPSQGAKFPWDFIVQEAIAENDLEAVSALLDGGYWDVHRADDLALRSFCRGGKSVLRVPEYNPPTYVRHFAFYVERRPRRYSKRLCHRSRPSIQGYKDRSILLMLLERGANVHANRGESLRNALLQNDVLTTLILLEYGADIKVLASEPWAFLHGSSLLIPLPHGADIYISKPWDRANMNDLQAVSFVMEVGQRIGICQKEARLRFVGNRVVERLRLVGRDSAVGWQDVAELWRQNAELDLLDGRDPFKFLKNSGYHSFTYKSYMDRGSSCSSLRNIYTTKPDENRETKKATKGLKLFLGLS
ncbi:hypothetical protein BC936DRAFT_149880 [Jimgerdemannia flammicorona]|uniref:F-box domain-containing protein n=1 Tax=Jimgerdemannia flammicorona TaxID=994334 RepID=A0A433CZX2_9FUNG|nr:hypothetical protein BC936DRAFT_149880 [Jimgerdemannia flammicorona]